MFDIESLLLPVTAENPAGDNLEYADVDQLERRALGTPGVYDPKTQEEVGAVEPDWREVRDTALALFARTKDLRVALHLSFALVKLDGWSGLASGLGLIEALLARFWDTLYPSLDAEMDNDPIERVNVLANLVGTERAMPMYRSLTIVESREVGRFSLRDLDVALGRIAPRDGDQAPNIEFLKAAWVSGNAELNASRQAGVEAGLRSVKAINALFQEKTGEILGLEGLQQLLYRLHEFYRSLAPAEADSGTAIDGAEGQAQASGPLSAARKPGTLACRADAVRQLREVSEFLKRSEPGNPATLFIDRAIRLADMNFAAIVLELMPDAKDRIELLGGMKLDAAAAATPVAATPAAAKSGSSW